MADRVYEVRLDLLARNLELVTRVFDYIAERFAAGGGAVAGRDLAEPIEALRAELKLVRAAVQQNSYNEAALALNRTFRQLNEIEEQATELPMQKTEVLFPRSDELSTSLVTEAKHLLKAIDKLRNSNETASARWAALRRLDSTALDVFSEYVDLVRGIAMRRAEMDDQLCRIADRLIKTVESGEWRSLTIPARRERMQASTAEIIRLGFPEWTVFSLPLAVHEYGHVVVRTSEELAKAPIADEVARFKGVLIADVFATLTAGPAYACALFTSRLDPTAELSAHRARAVLGALDELAGEGEAWGFVERIASAWRAAVEGCGVDAATSDVDVSGLVQAVRGQLLGQEFPIAEWQGTVAPLAEKLGGVEEHEISLGATADVRHVLNAAWVAWFGGQGELRDIERRARALCLTLCRERQQVGQGTHGRESSAERNVSTPDVEKSQ